MGNKLKTKNVSATLKPRLCSVFWAALALAFLVGAAPAWAYDLPSATCPNNLNSCSAGDVVTTVVAAEPLNGDTCEGYDDTVLLQFTLEFDTTANERYDLGVFVSVDGGTVQEPSSALECVGAAPVAGVDGDLNAFPDADNDLFQDLDSTATAGDTCGDVSTAQGPVQWTVVAEVSCSSIDADGNLKVPSCRIWEQNKNGDVNLCTNLAEAGTGSKCDCTDLDFTGVLDPCVTALCSDGNVCTTDSCDSSSGEAVCINDPNDPNLPPQCVGGDCEPQFCDTDGNICTEGRCNEDNTCADPVPVADGTASGSTCGVGECAATGTCQEGVDTCTPGTPGTELCGTGIDEDCDDEIDEGFNDGDACSDGIGACAADGVYVCTADGLDTECNAVPGTPGTELCGTGIDEDCDGEIDEGFNDGDACSDGIGACAADGVYVCTADGLDTECNAVPGTPGTELCGTGIDEDCDDEIDEGFNDGDACSDGIGACAADGVYVCTADGLDTECNAVPGTPGTELCGTGIDEDCDDEIDEGFNDGDACSDGIGACAADGVYVCTADGLDTECNAVPGTPGTELCGTGIDEDCDDEIDEGFNDGDACSDGIGACAADGVYVCTADGLDTECNAVPGTPGTELCGTGIDEDCDDEIDEGFNDGDACSDGIGACAADGVYVCTADGLDTECNAVPGTPGTELCGTGIDEDCDDEIDEGFNDGDACSDGIGACAADGVYVCTADGLDTECNAVPGTPGTELCGTGIDEDCDDEIDEGFNDGDACSDGIGACAADGVYVCTADGLDTECNAVPGTPGTELCGTGIDEDCDDEIDEGFNDGDACSDGIGACAADGVYICTADGLDTECNAVPGTPGTELCGTGIDEDCDDEIDEGFNDGDACSDGIGACAADGVYVCTADGLDTECNAVPGTPSDEICDNLDNDCDGSTDEDTDQPTTCGEDECASTGVMACVGGELQPDTCDPDSTDGLDCQDGDDCTSANGQLTCEPNGDVCEATECGTDVCTAGICTGIPIDTDDDGIADCEDQVDVFKRTLIGGVPFPLAIDWQFSLDNDLDLTATLNTQTSECDATGECHIDFGGADLTPEMVYTLCEENMPAGWSVGVQLDGVQLTHCEAEGNPFGDLDCLYNPDYLNNPPQDLGTRCIDFAVYCDLAAAGFNATDIFPGGCPRTIGFWKNWSTCTGGGQAANAESNGGPLAGWFLLDDLLAQTIGDLNVDTCDLGVSVLDKRDILKNKKRANDGAYEVASQLLATQVNLAVGAKGIDPADCNGFDVVALAAEANAFLDCVDFNGEGSFLPSKGPGSKDTACGDPDILDRTEALGLAGMLDAYNNGILCGGCD